MDRSTAASARGMFTGNRGVIHESGHETAFRQTLDDEGLDCLRFAMEGRAPRRLGSQPRRDVPGWSELFFLDEVTALAAGHRPCFACRRADAVRFAGAFAIGNEIIRLNAPGMDEILHRERRQSSRQLPHSIAPGELRALPDGAMIMSGEQFFAMRDGQAIPWNFRRLRRAGRLRRFAASALSGHAAQRGQRLAGRLPPAMASERRRLIESAIRPYVGPWIVMIFARNACTRRRT